ncbi:hypothetical protein NQ318_001594 [Aromia moschata]|uniref:DDE-1 domain-containing protein n=1 Tax=Aromia moschata TaxID=1265417 RepID=A0AAV8Y156_9CUCU|nr:hypothetical protein NQ318_001594 [Aromia moschata]
MEPKQKINIYNADEFGLQYKSLPKKTLVLPNEKEVPGHKPVKERITVMVCANASGTYKIPLLAIGKYQKPRCFNRVDKPPVQYEAQSSAWMSEDIFRRWFTNVFVPHVTQF